MSVICWKNRLNGTKTGEEDCDSGETMSTATDLFGGDEQGQMSSKSANVGDVRVYTTIGGNLKYTVLNVTSAQ